MNQSHACKHKFAYMGLFSCNYQEIMLYYIIDKENYLTHC